MWMKTLRGRKLSRKQEEVLQRYEENPHGRERLPMAQLLFSQGLKDEAIEVLMAALSEDPLHTVTRVVLVDFLWRKGLFGVAWRLIQDPQRGNVEGNDLAWTLIFKLACVLHKEPEARGALAHLQSSSSLDETTQGFVRRYCLSGLAQVRKELLRDYDPATIQWDEGDPLESSVVPSSGGSGPARSVDFEQSEDPEEFCALSLEEIFVAPSSSSQEDGEYSPGAEIDSLTLAEIYEKQHCFAQALKVYRRLSLEHPHHDGIRKRILLVQKKMQDQQQSGLEDVDDVMAALDDQYVLDRKRAFLEKLLENLHARSGPLRLPTATYGRGAALSSSSLRDASL